MSTAAVKPAPPEDLKFITLKVQELLPEMHFRNETVLLTGATGFFGKWLTQTLFAMNDELGLNNRFVLLTRDVARTNSALPWLEGRKDVDFIEADVRSAKTTVKFTTVIHGAAAASQALNEDRPEEMFDTIVDGTKKILNIAEKSGCRRFQLISSGGIYGPQPPMIPNLPESYLGAPPTMDARSAYGEAKRAAEFLAGAAHRRAGFQLSVPRCFAFIGPYLPLDTHFAAGNFLKCLIDGQPIKIGGDGTPFRSYLYAADLVVWLMVMLLKPSGTNIYNVGSGKAVSISDLAQTMHLIGSKLMPARGNMEKPILIAQLPDPKIIPSRYVPCVKLAEAELSLKSWTSLETAIDKTLRWNLN